MASRFCLTSVMFLVRGYASGVLGMRQEALPAVFESSNAPTGIDVATSSDAEYLYIWKVDDWAVDSPL